MEPKLTREVEIPKTRACGGGGVFLASMAMISVMAASGMVVKLRPEHASARMEPRVALPVEAALVDRFHRLLRLGDEEGALEAYQSMPPSSTARTAVWDLREVLARIYFGTQLERLGGELDRGECDLVGERLQRLERLLPDKQVPSAMAPCVAVAPKFAPRLAPGALEDDNR
ncbi:MAG: hypothetical protein HY698_01780 [Deltaproteobacteria bacterium]|nr:hypothetical protein [Deltaproteobacteria bacterium]